MYRTVKPARKPTKVAWCEKNSESEWTTNIFDSTYIHSEGR